MAPIDSMTIFGKSGAYLVYLLIGIGFGMVLEMSGFGDSRKLAAQFYFREMTVLKVMFTAIIIAMVLVFGFSTAGLMDFDRVFVNPTYLFPGIVGGLIMGVGFIIGGFCPGTSLVAAATLKIDGMFFVGGAFFGVFMFGETVSLFQSFYHSSSLGRLTLPDLFNADNGVIVLCVVLMALTMFYWAEISERIFGANMTWKSVAKIPSDRIKLLASAGLVFMALMILVSGQPDAMDKWEYKKKDVAGKLKNRAVHIHPYELLEVMNDPMLYVKILDFRRETDFNLFHLENARLSYFSEIDDRRFIRQIKQLPANTVFVVLSNGEGLATTAYKGLMGQGILNLYILDGGINNWLAHFPLAHDIARKAPGADSDQLKFKFNYTVGEKSASSNPEKYLKRVSALQFEKKIKIQRKKAISGGCG